MVKLDILLNHRNEEQHNMQKLLVKTKWFGVAIILIILDQWTKHLATHNLPAFVSRKIIPFVNFKLTYNTGAAFSFLSSASGWQNYFFIILASILTLGICIWILKTSKYDWFKLTSLTFIVAGAIGNLIDRASYGFVIDFIDVYYKTWHWPTFNLADSFITIGVILLIIKITTENST
jgi:signal peptidase II